MLLDIIAYCCLNTTTTAATDDVDNLVERLFEAMTANAGTTTDAGTTGGEDIMSWQDHLRDQPCFAQTLYDVAWTHDKWVQDFINWRPGDCSWLGQASPIVGECYFGFGYRECRAGRELFYEHSLQTCGHE